MFPPPDSADLADLADRWSRARLAALPPGDGGEATRAAAALVEDADIVLRRVFDNSFRLGSGFRRWAGVDLTLVDLERVLPALGAPCAAGGYSRTGDRLSTRSERRACAPDAPCAWWREAIYGLVSGLSSTVRYTRVSAPSPTSADPCVDLLHVDIDDPARHAPVPHHLQERLEAAAEKAARVVPGATVEFLGFQEGALYVRAHAPTSACSMDGFLMSVLRHALPDVDLRDANPRSVLPE